MIAVFQTVLTEFQTVSTVFQTVSVDAAWVPVFVNVVSLDSKHVAIQIIWNKIATNILNCKDELVKGCVIIVEKLNIRSSLFVFLTFLFDWSVNPADGNPLWCTIDFFQSPFQNSETYVYFVKFYCLTKYLSVSPDCFINIIVYYCQIKKVSIRLLQTVAFFCQSFQRPIIILE